MLVTILSLILSLNEITSTFHAEGCPPNLHSHLAAQIPKVKVYDQFLGKGDSLAIQAARYNSEKGYLIALVSSNDTALLKITRDVINENMINGRTRMIIILGDKKEGTHNSVFLFANGKFIDGFLQLGNSVGSGYEFTTAIAEIYDQYISPKFPYTKTSGKRNVQK